MVKQQRRGYEARVYWLVHNAVAETGACPTYQQMADTLGAASKATIARAVDGLVAKGRLRRIARRGSTQCLTPIWQHFVFDPIEKRLVSYQPSAVPRQGKAAGAVPAINEREAVEAKG